MISKVLIFDASTLISFSMNGILDIVKDLKKDFNGKFLITKDVKREVIDKPITIKKFKLEALKIKQLLDEKILEMPSSIDIEEKEISKITEEIKKMGSSIFRADREINLIDSGEASCLALSSILNKKKVENVICIDERTTRVICEKPRNLKNLMEKKLHTTLKYNKKEFKFFSQFKIIRSVELVYVAYKKNLIKIGNGDVLDALLYALKFKGCAVSMEEIDEIKRIGEIK
jgi:hypothetical protein